MASVQVRGQRCDDWQPEPPDSALSASSTVDCIVLAPARESARAAREFTVATLRRWHLDEFITDGVLIASELVTNAICHGTQAGEDVELSWSYQLSRLTCVVTDRAVRPPVMAADDPEAETGHGLQIIGALAAAWGWTRLGGGAKAVWAALQVPRTR